MVKRKWKGQEFGSFQIKPSNHHPLEWEDKMNKMFRDKPFPYLTKGEMCFGAGLREISRHGNQDSWPDEGES